VKTRTDIREIQDIRDAVGGEPPFRARLIFGIFHAAAYTPHLVCARSHFELQFSEVHDDSE
jgi:hypothetical protein